MAEKSNPRQAPWLPEGMEKALDTLRRVDQKGVLYEMDYTADYYDPAVIAVAKKAAEKLKAGCSVFSVYNTENEYMLCRNYDYYHKDPDGAATGLNVVIRTAPEGKLKSLSVCDAYWLNPAAYHAGALDDGTTDISALTLAPYMCVDGMNEAGLTASLLVVDLKEGERHTDQNTGKTRVIPSMLLRMIIDSARTIEEAVAIAGQVDVYSTGGTDLHIYLSQKDGISAVLEWRQYKGDDRQKLYVTYTNACTNFFVGFDDAEDARNKDGSFRELFSGFPRTFNHYRYGYGHGYHRFNQIVAALERYILPEANSYGIRNSLMEESQAMDVLKVCSQNPGTEHTSFTQYSALYNQEKLSVCFCLQRDYGHVYGFGLAGTV